MYTTHPIDTIARILAATVVAASPLAGLVLAIAGTSASVVLSLVALVLVSVAVLVQCDASTVDAVDTFAAVDCGPMLFAPRMVVDRSAMLAAVSPLRALVSCDGSPVCYERATVRRYLSPLATLLDGLAVLAPDGASLSRTTDTSPRTVLARLAASVALPLSPWSTGSPWASGPPLPSTGPPL